VVFSILNALDALGTLDLSPDQVNSRHRFRYELQERCYSGIELENSDGKGSVNVRRKDKDDKCLLGELTGTKGVIVFDHFI
jgi:hypothetical protein